MGKKKVKTESEWMNKVRSLFILSFVTIAARFILAEFVWSNGEDVLKHLILTIMCCIAPFLLILMEKISRKTKIFTASSFAVLMVAPIFLQNRLELFIDIVVGFVIFLVIIYFTKTKSSEISLIWIFDILYSLFVFVFGLFDYCFVESLKYAWKVLPVLSVILGIFVTVKFYRKHTNFNGCIFYGVITTFFIFVVFFSLYVNLNYVLDFSEPQEVIVKIEEKQISRSSGSRRNISFLRYYLIFYIDGEDYKLPVSYKDYQYYQIGDSYNVDMYKGAFGDSFYMSGEHND